MSKIGKKTKMVLIIYLILWLILAIVFVLPLPAEVHMSLGADGSVMIESLFNNIANNILDIGVRSKSISMYSQDLLVYLGYYTFFYAGFILIMFLKTNKKGAYHDIEHGSSDWCEHGEQYKVLNKKEGIILAQDNYLPVDKKGNVNVLIVGRIWSW